MHWFTDLKAALLLLSFKANYLLIAVCISGKLKINPKQHWIWVQRRNTQEWLFTTLQIVWPLRVCRIICSTNILDCKITIKVQNVYYLLARSKDILHTRTLWDSKYFRAEYGAFWKCVTAGFVYMVTQLVKMIFLATFFPTSGDDDDVYLDREIPFDAVTVRKCQYLTQYFDNCYLELIISL